MKNRLSILLSLMLSSLVYAQSEECQIADYPFNNNADNQVSSNFNGTVYGAQLTDDKDGVSNSAYEFDGVNDYIGITNQPVISSTNFTITAWANMAGFGGGQHPYNPIFVQRNSVISSTSSLIALFAQYTDNKVSFLVRNQAYSNLTPITVVGDVIDFDEWHFYAAVKDSTSLTLYVDSVAVGTVPCPTLGPFNTGTDNADIGRHYYSGAAKSFFNGTIDDVEIYDCALAEEEILEIYNPIIKPPVSLVENYNELISFYPNPVTSVLEIENLTDVNTQVQILTMQGQVINTFDLETNHVIDASMLPSSTYFLRVFSNSQIQVYKFIKTQE